MPFKFEQLDVWKMSLDYVDLMYELAEKLPESERYHLRSQITRGATSISLNIAEGSTSQSDAEQHRFLEMTLRSLIEAVACQRPIARRNYTVEKNLVEKADSQAQELAKRLHAFRHSLMTFKKSIQEEQAGYATDEL